MAGKRAMFMRLLMLLAGGATAATPVEFYQTVTDSSDGNMISMTTDLFYSQLQSMDGYTVVDRRGTHYSAEAASPSAISFYAEIQESGGAWECTLNAISLPENRSVSETKRYDSYYKILLDAKASLTNVLTNLSGALPAEPQAAPPRQEGAAAAAKQAAGGAGLEALAGTWSGEQYIDKVVILRGGRGFVIFKNGASMNITVSVQGTSVTVRQTGRANASFFPELPREVALRSASGAQPVTWALTLLDGTTLRGTKTALVEDGSAESGAAAGTYEVEWHKH